MANSRSKFITQGRYVLPGSNESGVPCASKVSVPPLCAEGLTTADRALLNAAAVLVRGGEALAPALLPAADLPFAGGPDTTRPTPVAAAATTAATASAA